MVEKIERKVEVFGDPNAAQENKRDFGTSFEDLLNNLEVEQTGGEDENAVGTVPEIGNETEVEEKHVEENTEEQVTGLGDIDLPPAVDDKEEEETPSTGDPESPEVVPEEKAESEKHTRADDDDSKKEIEELKKDPHTPAKTKKNIDRLLGKISSLKKSLSEKEAELNTIRAEKEQLVNKPSMTEDEKRELVMYRRKYALEKDDTLKSYDEKMKSTEVVLADIVRSMPLQKDQKEAIIKMGFEKFASLKDSFREFMEILDDSDPAQAAVVRAKYADLISTKREKSVKAKELAENAEQWWSEQEKIVSEQQQQSQKYVEEITKLKEEFYASTVSKDPYFRAVETTNLKGDELERAKSENAKRAVYQRDLKAILEAQTIEDQKKVVYRAALARPLADRVRELEAKLKEANSTLKKIQGARTSRSSGVTPPPQARENVVEDFGTALERLARGGR